MADFPQSDHDILILTKAKVEEISRKQDDQHANNIETIPRRLERLGLFEKRVESLEQWRSAQDAVQRAAMRSASIIAAVISSVISSVVAGVIVYILTHPHG